jgi:hypothetical protein
LDRDADFAGEHGDVRVLSATMTISARSATMTISARSTTMTIFALTGLGPERGLARLR